jgi:cell division septation protein DedD
MEEPLKARLIGASILVVLAVVLVPELLSGPKNPATGGTTPASPKGTRTVTIDLGGAVAAGAKVEPRPDTQPPGATPPAMPDVGTSAPKPASPVATTADRSVPTEETPPPGPASTPEDTTAARPVPKPTPTTLAPSQAPVAKPSVAEPAVAAAAPGKGGYSVQVGAFSSDAAARKLVNQLKGDGLPAYTAPLSKSGKTLYRVRVGPAPDKAGADQLAAKLKARGLPVAVVPGG